MRGLIDSVKLQGKSLNGDRGVAPAIEAGSTEAERRALGVKCGAERESSGKR